MSLRGVFFPWRLFWNFFVTLVVLLNVMALLALAIASYVIDFSFYTTEPLIVLGLFFVLSLIGAFWFSYRFSKPLQRVILKALRMANKKQFGGDLEIDEILFEEPGEYFELEVALDKIRKKMKKRRLQLAHEREEFQALIGTLGDGIVTVTPDLKLRFMNAKFAAQFLGREMVAPGGDAIALSNVFREPEILELFTKTFATGEMHSKRLKLLSKMDHSFRFYSLTVSPLREERDRAMYGVLALFHDITDLKLAEQIRMEFVENASHELRTPLTSVKGFVETIKEDIGAGRTEQVPHFLGIVSKNVDRLNDLVNDMLTLSALENGSGLKKEIIFPEELSQDLIERMASLASEKQVVIHLRTEAQAFSADPGKVEQVLQNLLGNAIKYVQSKGRIEVRWEETLDAVLLKVIDNGPGIGESHLSRLFERFYRIDKSRTRDVGGTGLGLAIVKHIMQNHGGSVAVKSELGRGSEFVCIFPK